jgi:hypothetical protein
MGTYDDEDPNATITQRIANSIKKTVSDVAYLAAPHSITDRKANIDAPVDSDASTPSNTGASGQSTDAYNKY